MKPTITKLVLISACAILPFAITGCGGGGGGGGGNNGGQSSGGNNGGNGVKTVEGTWYPDMVELNNQLEADNAVTENHTIVRVDAQTIKYADNSTAGINSNSIAGENIALKPITAEGGSTDPRLGRFDGTTGYNINTDVASQTVQYGKTTLVLQALNDPSGTDRKTTWKTLPESAWAGNWTAVYLVTGGPGFGRRFTVKASLNYQLSSSTADIYAGMGYLDKLAQVTIAVQDDTTAEEKTLLEKYFNITNPDQNYIEGINAKNQPNKVNTQYAFAGDHPLINGKDAGGELVLVLQANGGVIDKAATTVYNSSTGTGEIQYNDLLANGTWLVVRPPNRLVATLHTGGYRKIATHFNESTDMNNHTYGTKYTFGSPTNVTLDATAADFAQYISYAFVPDLYVTGQIFDNSTASGDGTNVNVQTKNWGSSPFRFTDDAAKRMTYVFMNAAHPTGTYAAVQNWGATRPGPGTTPVMDSYTTHVDPGTMWGSYQSQIAETSWAHRWLSSGNPQNLSYGLSGIWQYNDNADIGFAATSPGRAGEAPGSNASLARLGARTYNGPGQATMDGTSHMNLSVDSFGLGTATYNGTNLDTSKARLRPDYNSASYMVSSDAAGRTVWTKNGQAIKSVRANMDIWTNGFGGNDPTIAKQSKIAQDLTGTIYYLDHVAIYSDIPENGRPGDTVRTPRKVTSLDEVYGQNPNLN